MTNDRFICRPLPPSPLPPPWNPPAHADDGETESSDLEGVSVATNTFTTASHRVAYAAGAVGLAIAAGVYI